MSTKRNSTIDLGKYIASLMVIAIHVALFGDVNNFLYFVVVNIICRVAVPFFAMCTGYFMACKIEPYYSCGAIFKVVGRQWKHLALLYIIWSLIYMIRLIPVWIDTGWLSFNAFIDFGISTIISMPYYHMWYILSALYALPLLGLCLRFLNKRLLIWAAFILWIVKSLSYGYAQWTPSVVKNIFNVMQTFSGIRDGLFCILPMMLLGAYISNQKKTRKRKIVILGLIISATFFFIEAFILRHLGQNAVSFIIMVFPTSYFLFQLILSFDMPKNMNRICGRLGAASLLIYLIHPLIIDLTAQFTKQSILHFLLTAIISTVISIIYVKIKSKYYLVNQ